jgi:hypothetical protein
VASRGSKGPTQSTTHAGRGIERDALTPAEARALSRSAPLTPAEFRALGRIADKRVDSLRVVLEGPPGTVPATE